MPERKPQRVALDAYVVDTLMPDLVGHDKTPAAFVVYLYLWKESRRSRRAVVAASHRTIAEDTGLSKSAVQAALRRLKRRQLVRSRLAFPTAVPEYQVLRPWRRARGELARRGAGGASLGAATRARSSAP
jgi:DNA-binding transcriptional MocR family regulator